MKILIVFSLAVTLTQGTVQRPQSNIPITSSDPFTREMEDKLGRILEIQNEKEMTSPPVSTKDRHEAAMMTEMVKQLENLTNAVGLATAASSDARARKSAYKEMDSQSGKLLAGLKYFVPVINDAQTNQERPKPLDEAEIRGVYERFAPRLAGVINSIKTGVIQLNETRSVTLQLRAFQETGKRGGTR